MAFSDCQDIHRLKTKLRQCSFVLESCIDVARQCADHYNVLASVEKNTIERDRGFEMYIAFVQQQRRIVTDMLDQSSGIADLVCTKPARADQ